MSAIFAFTLVFTLIPIIPGLIYEALRLVKFPLLISVDGHTIDAHKFSSWYWALCALTASALLIRLRYSSWKLERSRPKTKEDELLNATQMRFVISFALRNELEAYRTNKLPTHIHKARELWRRLLRSLRELFGMSIVHLSPKETRLNEELLGPEFRLANHSRHRFGAFGVIAQAQDLQNTFSWFHVSPYTQQILSAFEGLREKNHRPYKREEGPRSGI